MSTKKSPQTKMLPREIHLTYAQWEAIKKVASFYRRSASQWMRDLVLPTLFEEVREIQKYDKKAFKKEFINELFNNE